MRIHDLELERNESRTRLSARFTLEDTDDAEPPRIWIDYPPDAADVRPSPEAFLLLGYSLACWVGEARILVEGPICPVLRENLDEAMSLLGHWYPHVRPATIEATAGLRALEPREPRRTGMLMSGGVDALATLAHHLETYPEDHPDRIREGFHIRGGHGFDFDDTGAMVPWRVAEYDRHVEKLRALGRSTGFSLTSIATNALMLYPQRGLKALAANAAAFLAPGHALSARMTDLIISSSGSGTDLAPHNSHPMLDPLFSTSAVRVLHPLPFLDRFAKIEQIARYPELMQVLTVCLHLEEPEPGTVNCGRCKKCVRTMLSLIAIGRMEDAPTFAKRDLTADDVAAIRSVDERYPEFYEPLIPLLERAGRDDLARAAEDLVRRQKARGSLRHRASRRIRLALRGRGSSRP